MLTAKTLKNLSHPQITYVKGPETQSVSHCKVPDLADSESLVFISKESDLTQALAAKSPILVVHQKINTNSVPDSVALFTSSNIQMAMSQILPYFDKSQSVWEQSPAISPLAYIHPEAKLGPDVIVQAFAWIGADVIVGAGSRIGAHSVIQDRTVIGQGTTIHPHVFIGTDTELGTECEIYSHTSIASFGFGFASTKEFKHYKIPQVGRVILGDRVRIGANCAIDRATLNITKIASGTKMDNLCHLAHNCEIGEDSLVAAGFMTAGSTKIGKRFVVGGNSVVADHIEITDDVMLAGRSTVTNDIKEKGPYGGYPTQPLKDALKTIASLTHLVQMRKQLSKIAKHLNLDLE